MFSAVSACSAVRMLFSSARVAGMGTKVAGWLFNSGAVSSTEWVTWYLF
jgi:hypothetical protein